ncbi:MAG: Gfo/Idh/MocA family oxidoreductase, partial [Myxococcota bacterium]
ARYDDHSSNGSRGAVPSRGELIFHRFDRPTTSNFGMRARCRGAYGAAPWEPGHLTEKLRVAVIGAGWAGTQRAAAVVAHPRTELALVVDVDEDAGRKLAARYDAPSAVDWTKALSETELDALVVATPHAQLAEVAVASLEAGHHVLVEAPMGRNISEAVAISAAAGKAERVLKLGFNHRYHPALTRAHAYFSEGVIGPIINLRVRYGNGQRPGELSRWREDRELVGGGQLTAHGIHVLDLVHWFVGPPKEVFSFLQTASWPIKPLEDSAFALLRFESGAVASLHTAWTQWSDLFSFEVFGSQGSISVDGLGHRYGHERLVVARRRTDGGAPYTETTQFDDEDISWSAEWAEFVAAVEDDEPYMGSPQEGIMVMNMLDGLYRSAEAGQLITM